MKAKALAVLIPALFLSTAALAQSSPTPRDPATREPSKEAAPNDTKASDTKSVPSAQDRAFVASLMGRVVEPGKFANWIAPPVMGINRQPVEFEYVRFD